MGLWDGIAASVAGPLIGGLFGKGDSGAAGYTANQNQALTNISGVNSGLNSMLSSDRNDFQTSHPAAIDATGKYADYLSKDPWTDQYTAGTKAGGVANIATHYLNAQAHIARQFAGDPDNSIGIGAGIANENAKAGALAGVDNDAWMNEQESTGKRLGALSSLLLGLSGTARGNVLDDSNALVRNNEFTAGANNQYAQQGYGRQDSTDSLVGSIFGKGADAIGQIYGRHAGDGQGAAPDTSYPWEVNGNPTGSYGPYVSEDPNANWWDDPMLKTQTDQGY